MFAKREESTWGAVKVFYAVCQMRECRTHVWWYLWRAALELSPEYSLQKRTEDVPAVIVLATHSMARKTFVRLAVSSRCIEGVQTR